MILFKQLSVVSRPPLNSEEATDIPLLSLIVLCRSEVEFEKLNHLIGLVSDRSAQIELIVIAEAPSSNQQWPVSLGAMCEQHHARLLWAPNPCGLISLRLNEGILASRGAWLWLIEEIREIGQIDFLKLTETLGGHKDERVIVRVHPDEIAQLASIPGVKLPWMDLLFKGINFPIENILFARSVFEQFGLLDPHVAIATCWATEYLTRICRYVRFTLLIDPTARTGIQLIRAPSHFHYWVDIDRRTLLHPHRIADYPVDDLEQFQTGLPRKEAWKIYLNYVLPYYYTFRPYLPPGFPELPQSFPPQTHHYLCLKGSDYETLIDVGLRNFDVFAQGSHYFKSSYRHVLNLEGQETATVDAVVLIRTVDDISLSLARQEARGGIPVGYALDDDLLNFYQYGDGFAAFRPGHPAYDTMVATIKASDVVLCSSPYIEQSVQAHNPRTAHYEGSVLPEFLESEPKPASLKTTFTFGYAGGGYRAQEMLMLWPAIERICDEYGAQVRFELWGIEARDLPRVHPQVTCRPFSESYYEYLGRLRCSGFDAMLVPLMHEPAPRRSKAPNKLYESVVAGAIGLFSDVPPYQIVKSNRLGIVVSESTEAWYKALREVLAMTPDAAKRLRQRCFDFVRLFYTTPAMLPVHESSLSAVTFHGYTRQKRNAHGRPVVMYVFPVVHGTGGGEITLRRRMELAQTAGIAPLVVVPEYLRGTAELQQFKRYLDSLQIPMDFCVLRPFVVTPPEVDFLPLPEEEQSVRELFNRHAIALVHTGGYIPAIGKICSELGIPHVVAHYGVDDRFRWATQSERLPFKYCDLVHSDTIRYAKRWAELFACEFACIRDVAPKQLFDNGFDRLFGRDRLRSDEGCVRISVVGTLMERKSQLEIIQAIRLLLKEGYPVRLALYGGLDAHPDYAERCQQEVKRMSISDYVSFKGHVAELSDIYAETDIVVSASTFESLPTAIKEATAAGCLVVASKVGGITELMKDGINSILIDSVSAIHIAQALRRAIQLTEAEDRIIRQNAYAMAVSEFHERRGLADLLRIYNQVLEYHQRSELLATKDKRSLSAMGQTDQPLRSESPHQLPAGYVRIVNGIKYRLVPKRNNWYGLDVLLLTQERAVQGQLTLRIYAFQKQLLREISVDLTTAKHNEWLPFCFNPIVSSANREFTLIFTLSGMKAGNVVGLFESNSLEHISRRALRRLGVPLPGNSLHCRLWYS